MQIPSHFQGKNATNYCKCCILPSSTQLPLLLSSTKRCANGVFEVRRRRLGF